jgi:hypothetical protein
VNYYNRNRYDLLLTGHIADCRLYVKEILFRQGSKEEYSQQTRSVGVYRLIHKNNYTQD